MDWNIDASQASPTMADQVELSRFLPGSTGPDSLHLLIRTAPGYEHSILPWGGLFISHILHGISYNFGMRCLRRHLITSKRAPTDGVWGVENSI